MTDADSLIEQLFGSAAAVSELDEPPTLETSVVWCGHYRSDGELVVHEIFGEGGTYKLRKLTWDGETRQWEPAPCDAEGSTALDVIRAEDQLHVLTSATAVRYLIEEGALPIDALLEVLQATGGEVDPDDWDEDAVADWNEQDEILEDMILPWEWHRLWASVNGIRVTALLTNGPESATPVLVDEDEVPPVRPLETVASYSWHSESGGAPISWDGGASVERVNGHVAIDWRWGDVDEESSIILLPEADDELARVLASWLLELEAEVAAAFSMEALEVRALTSDMREQWEALIETFTESASVTLAVSDAAVASLRQELRESPRYLQTLEALSSPTSELGRALLQRLIEFETDGVLGPIEFGNWNDE